MKKRPLGWISMLVTLFFSCSTSKQISRLAKKDIFSNEAFISAHAGISIYEPATLKYWYNYQGNKYFVPASNTKLATCYAAMKYLGDSLAGLKYYEYDSLIVILPTADPTFLHPDFKNQRIYDFLLHSSKKLAWGDRGMVKNPLGNGWAWDDYNDSYMAEISEFPIYGNLVTFTLDADSLISFPSFFAKERLRQKRLLDSNFLIRRNPGVDNTFYIQTADKKFVQQTLPFATYEVDKLLHDTLHKEIGWLDNFIQTNEYKRLRSLYSQPTDSVLKPMMQNSDNFFAEQSLLMVGYKQAGSMDDEKIIDTLLKTDFNELPQKPTWVDGSGLSRYNLFSPQDLIFILNKMKNDFGMERVKNILPTGNNGTLTNYYKAEEGYIFAKTGTLSGVVALSGFLYTKKNKLVIFSVLVNNHNYSATVIRRAIEKFIEDVRDKK